MNTSKALNAQRQRLTQSMHLCIALGLLWTSGMIRIDFGGVPFTMQTVAVMLIALCNDKKTALQSMIMYSILSMIWMTNVTTGLQIGSTFGYILGFIPATKWIQQHNQKGKQANFGSRIYTLLIAQMIIWLAGFGWLAQFIGYQSAFYIGVLPFVCTDLLKLSIAAWMAQVVSVVPEKTD